MGEEEDFARRNVIILGWRPTLSVDHEDGAVLVHPVDVPEYVGLPLPAIVAVGALEPRLHAALVPQVPLQGALPHENAGAVRAGELLVLLPGEPSPSLLAALGHKTVVI